MPNAVAVPFPSYDALVAVLAALPLVNAQIGVLSFLSLGPTPMPHLPSSPLYLAPFCVLKPQGSDPVLLLTSGGGHENQAKALSKYLPAYQMVPDVANYIKSMVAKRKVSNRVTYMRATPYAGGHDISLELWVLALIAGS
ncbi:hypothetical protein TeGR_g8780, partial [Tetraparma gracilis]